MFRLQAATGLAALALAGPAAAECRNDWDMYAAFKLTDVATGSTWEHFNSGENRVAVMKEGRAWVEGLYLKRGSVIKGLVGQDAGSFLKQMYSLVIQGHLAAIAVRNAVGAAPCSAAGVFDVDLDVKAHVSVGVEGVSFVRVKGTVKADGRGQIDFSIGFDTEPEQPAERRFPYTGTMTFDDQYAALPASLDVGGFSVEQLTKPTFIAAPGTTLEQLRPQLLSK